MCTNPVKWNTTGKMCHGANDSKVHRNKQVTGQSRGSELLLAAIFFVIF